MHVNDHAIMVMLMIPMNQDTRAVDATINADADDVVAGVDGVDDDDEDVVKIVYHMYLIDSAIADVNVVWLKLVSFVVRSINASMLM